MKRFHRPACLAFGLVFALLLSACASPAQESDLSGEPGVISGTLVLVDPSREEEPAPVLPESPLADEEPSFPDAEPESSAGLPTPQAEVSQAEQSVSQAESSAPPTSMSEASPPQTSPPAAANTARGAAPADEVRSVWISYLELNNLLKGKTQSQFTGNIRAVFDNCASYGLNTVVVHVRPFADAIYRSGYFPWSYLCTGAEGVDPGFDPLAIMVEEAHSRGLRFEAWVNPYRIRPADNTNAISADNQAAKWLAEGDGSVIRYNGVTSYNPASEKARALIVNGVRELVRGYGVDGIHIDDYFYPTTDAAFDAAFYSAYQSGGGTLGLADWRRQNVETLIRALYAGIKAEDPSVLFGISPQSSVYNNYHSMYLDVAKIAGGTGYCDYICPQIYFGYENGTQPFLETLESWNRMTASSPVDLYVGVAVYKVGVTDSWAGAGQHEWTQNTDLLMRMVQSSRNQGAYKGFVLYRYDSLFNPASAVADRVNREAENLRSVL